MEKPDVTPYPVGSICTIIYTIPEYAHDRGKECIIVGELAKRSDSARCDGFRYVIEIQGKAGKARIAHPDLRLKKFPPADDAWCRDKLNKILSREPLSAKGDVLVKEEEDALYGR